MNNLDKKYQELLKDILDTGVKKETRNGGTISVFGRQIRHKMSEGFPLLTTKKMYFKGIVTELLWFLSGDTNIKFLVDNNCHIWNGDAYKNWFENGRTEFDQFADPMFMSDDALGKEKFHEISMKWFIDKIKTDTEFAKRWGDLGPIYGKQWRKWNGQVDDISGIGCYHDQISNLIHDLKTNPDSRRLMVSAWNVGEIDQMVLPPCHYGFQVYTRELSFDERCKIQINRLDGMYSSEKDIFIKSSIDEVKLVTMNKNNIPTRAISLMFNMRSNDVPLGLPFNLASYGLLLQIIAKEVNMIPDELITSLGDAHIYVNQIDSVKEQLTREPYKLPKLVMVTNPELKFDEYVYDNFKLVNYQSHPSIKMPLSN